MEILVCLNHGIPASVLAEATDPLTFWLQVASLTGASIAVLTFLLVHTWPRIRTRLDSRSVQKRIGAESYTPDSIKRSLRHFIAPMCQDLDPSGGDEPRMVYGVRQQLFDALDDALSKPNTYKHLILLADSGMGKTTALLNYYVRHLRRWRKSEYKLALVPLSNSNADDQIKGISDQRDTVLFLDALDEDTSAVTDHRDRLRVLLKLTSEFRAVVISCRTQFFSKDEEIPRETGIIKVFARPAGEEAAYYFHKIYLSPFSDEQVEKYINRLYPFWQVEQRARAKQMVSKIPHLTARPMLLAHIDDLVRARHGFQYSYELYEEMIRAWLKREQGFIENTADLREFSERLAVDIYVNRVERKSERVKKSEVTTLANHWRIPVEDWKLTGRSLLNRDAEGNYKFAHRSIMEYLFVKRFLKADPLCMHVEWTDQMNSFLWDILDYELMIKRSLPFKQHNSESAVFFRSEETISILCAIVAEHISYIRFAQTLNKLEVRTPTFKALAELCAFIADPAERNTVGVVFFSFNELKEEFSWAFNFMRHRPSCDPGSLDELNEIPRNIRRFFEDHVRLKSQSEMWLEIAPPKFQPIGAIAFQTTAKGSLNLRNLSLLNAAMEKRWSTTI